MSAMLGAAPDADTVASGALSPEAQPAAEPAPALDAEKLVVYQIALELQALCSGLVPAQQRVLHDQMERASLSVVLNIAEGAGRFGADDKRRFYRFASGSAMECVGVLELLRNRGTLSEAGYESRRALLIRVIQMLSRLCGPPR